MLDQSAARGARGSGVAASAPASSPLASPIWPGVSGDSPYPGALNADGPKTDSSNFDQSASACTESWVADVAANACCSARVRKPRLSRGPATATNTQANTSRANVMVIAAAGAKVPASAVQARYAIGRVSLVIMTPPRAVARQDQGSGPGWPPRRAPGPWRPQVRAPPRAATGTPRAPAVPARSRPG